MCFNFKFTLVLSVIVFFIAVEIEADMYPYAEDHRNSIEYIHVPVRPIVKVKSKSKMPRPVQDDFVDPKREYEYPLYPSGYSSMIYALKMPERSSNVNDDKEYEGNFSSATEHHEENSMKSNGTVEEKIVMESNCSKENISNKEGLRSKLNKREYPASGYTEELKKKILDVHNLYRSNVTPPAANMEFMVRFSFYTEYSF
ncbi:hypothetical protein TNCT_472061 [Trichonephila clavata]|uniref:SCP domain-containing protein n=1 Tax=Trichonephila clavata TaxID=2740835 RepID=A0A8X6FCB9_TRICU|nr:hypothetical protein TNCT_472061 [Trichonephila clavata]